MVSSRDKTHQQSLTALNELLSEVQPIIDRHVEEMSPTVAKYLMDNFAKYLKINLQEDLKQKASTGSDYNSPFDDLMSDMSEYHEK